MPERIRRWFHRSRASDQGQPDVQARSRRRGRRLRWSLLMLGPVLVTLAAGYVYFTSGRYVETEDAFIQADMVMISPRVSGPIVEVAVRENEHVEAGAPLFRIDPAPFQIALAEAEARLRQAASGIRARKASYRQKREELVLAREDVAYAQRAFDRQAALARQDFASRAKYDEAKHDLDVARQQIAMLDQELAGILADLDGDADIPVERHSAYLAAKAARDRAALDLDHTTVRAPFDGVASRKPDLGDYVGAGTPAMSIVADAGVWVEANFKETELTHVRPGQEVLIEVDTYPDRAWHGSVESISQATGAEFALLPPQNATGNWVKVVQRIPVRITVPVQERDPPLRAGMSVTAEIDTGHGRELPGLVEAALARTGYLGEATARAEPAR